MEKTIAITVYENNVVSINANGLSNYELLGLLRYAEKEVFVNIRTSAAKICKPSKRKKK